MNVSHQIYFDLSCQEKQMGKDYMLGIYFSAKHKPFILHLTMPQEVMSGLVCNVLMLFNA